MKAQVMRRAWEIAREGQKNFGGKVSAYFAESLRMAWAETRRHETKDEMIERLEGLGFRRWTKYGKDRMYVDSELLGFECEYYKTGNMKWASFKGESISNRAGLDYRCAKTYLDLNTMKFHSDMEDLLAEAKALAKIA